MILTDDEIMGINQNAEFDSAIGYARKIESAVLEKLKAQEPSCWVLGEDLKQGESMYNGRIWFSNPVNSAWVPLYEHPLPPADVVRDARVAELEAVLRECREALVHCEGVFDEVRGYPITYDLTIEAIAKIDEVLPK